MNAGNYVLRIEERREVKCMRHKPVEMKLCTAIGAIIDNFSYVANSVLCAMC
jgi:hypothetical protein